MQQSLELPLPGGVSTPLSGIAPGLASRNEIIAQLVHLGIKTSIPPGDFRAEVSRVFRLELSHLQVIVSVSGWGQSMCDLVPFLGGSGRACLEAEAAVAGLQDVAAVG